MNRITESYINEFKKIFSFINDDISEIFEAFSAYCVLCQESSDINNFDDILTGGENDCAIDSLAIIADGEYINSKEEAESRIEQKRDIEELKFIFTQSKTSSSFDSGTILKLGAGVEDFFNISSLSLKNEMIKEKNLISNVFLSNARKIKNIQCVLYYVTTGKWTEDRNLCSKINKVKRDLDELNLFSSVDFKTVDEKGLHKLYKLTKEPIKREIELSDRITLPEMDKIEQAFLCVINAKEFLKLITQDNFLVKKVFYDNVRDFQGDIPVNREIKNTLDSPQAGKFVLLNNGVTIICKKLRNIIRNDYEISDYQIVNGCQTSHVLFYNRDLLNNSAVSISVKIIATQDDETVNKIIRSTNRQSVVSDSQFITLTEFHKSLEEFYNSFEAEKRLYYERRSRQYEHEQNIEKVRIVTFSQQLKAVASMFLDKPHISSQYYGKLINNVDGLFELDHKLIVYYTSAYVLNRLEFMFRNKQLDYSYRKYRYHVLVVIKFIIMKSMNIKKIPEFNSAKIEKFCNKILEIFYDNSKMLQISEKAIKIIEKVIIQNEDPERMKKLTATVDLLKKEIF
ncbi:AIPR family protein [Akkermansia sp.]|uniref:AIPR family protein n=1 Tax=Akkermansia sp. TaxID=1872421 RepID=UPI0025B83A3E|nr:AIPR family protein [Akkermansia sp.]